MKNRLKILRAERDWNQSDLAAQLGLQPARGHDLGVKETPREKAAWLLAEGDDRGERARAAAGGGAGVAAPPMNAGVRSDPTARARP